jgi:sugar/nucleoside kinase (ribokinase family)
MSFRSLTQRGLSSRRRRQVLAAIAVAGSLAACSSGAQSATATGKGTVTFLSWDAKATMQPLINEFQKENPGIKLSRFDPRSTETVYLSGYELLYEHATLIAECFAAIPSEVLTVFDPGPIVGDIPADLLELALTRANWTSLNRVEAETITRESGARDSSTHWAQSAGTGRGAVVRDGASGCWVVTSAGLPDEVIEHVAVPLAPVSAIDTSGAGDCHVGAFVAALSRGHSPGGAALWANAAAARAVARKGPATSPTLAETRADLQLVTADLY